MTAMKQKEIKPCTRAELMALLTKLPKRFREQREYTNALVCALIGHSRIVTTCFFGYIYCGRCEAQIGDTLGASGAKDRVRVIVDHNCDDCRATYKTLTWRDKLYAKNPFPKKKEGAG